MQRVQLLVGPRRRVDQVTPAIAVVSRRAFLERTSMAATALALLARAERARAQSGMFISLPPWAVARNVPWPEQARLAARVGYAGIDWAFGPARSAGAGATRALLAELKIQATIVNLPMQGPLDGDDDAFAAQLPTLAEDAAFCAAIGCRRFQLVLRATTGGPTKDEKWKMVRARLAAIAGVLAKHDIRLGLEFLGPLVFRTRPGGGGRRGAPPEANAPPPPPPVPFVWTLPETVRLAEDSAPNVGVTLDAWHWHHSGGTVGEIAATSASRIVHVHVSDAREMPPEQVQDNMRLLPGEGIINLNGFFQALRKIGYQGGVAPETIGPRIPDDMPPEESARLALEATLGVMKKAGAIAGALLLASSTIAAAQGLGASSSVRPPCPVAEDEKYAYSVEHPVQVGGSPVFGAARERRYLDALRGLEGQAVQYTRVGQAHAPDGTILDRYTVTHEGRDQPVTLYLDWYHFNTPKAPRGFSCAGPFNLTTPPPSPFQEMDDVRHVAIAQGETKEFAPIPLGADPAARRGAAFDRFRLLALASHAAVAKNARMSPDKLTPEMMPGTLFVAFPRACGDRRTAPTAIAIVAQNGAAMPKEAVRHATPDDLARLLPGVSLPPGSIGVVAQLTQPRPNDSIRITYADETCGAENGPSSAPIAFSGARPIETPMPPLPEGAAAPAEPVLIQVLLDFEGAVQRPTYVGGPAELYRAAADAVGRWRFEPARINGAPIAAGVLLQVRFAPAR